MIAGLARLALLAACLAARSISAAAPAASPPAAPPPVPPVAAAFSLGETPRAWLTAHPVLRVGVDDSWEPIEFMDGQGRYQGIVADWMNLVSQKLGVRFEYVNHGDWGAVMAAFHRGEIDVLASLSENPERRQQMLFTRPYLNFGTGLVTREDAPYAEELSDFPAGRLAVVQGYASNQAAHARAPHLSALLVNDTEEALLAVATGRADVAVATVLVAHYVARQHGLTNLRISFDRDDYPEGLAMAVRPELEPLRDILQAALDSVSAAERAAINSRWVDLQQVRRAGMSRAAKLSLLGLLASLVIMAGWIYTLRRQIKISQALQQRAEDAEDKARAMIDSIPAMFWMMRMEPGRATRFRYFSNRATELIGLKTDQLEMDFDTMVKRMHAEDRSRLLLLLERHTPALTTLHFEHRHFNQNGVQQGWAYMQAVPRQIGNSIVWHGCTVDISDRKNLETALEQSRNQLAELAAGVPGALWQFRREPDGQQSYSYMSDGIIGITGRTPAETNRLMLDKSFVSVHPEDIHILQGLMQRLTVKPGIDEARYRLRTAEGGWKWVQVAARAMPVGADGALVWNGVTLDASRIQQTEEALRHERQRLQDLADNLSGALWRLRRRADGSLHFDYVSEGVVAVAGRTAAEIMGESRSPLEEIVAEDRPRVMATLKESAEQLRPIEIEYSAHAANGSIERLFARAAVRIEDGQPVWTGVLFNVSERHRLQAQLADVRDRIEDIAANFPGAIFQILRGADGSTRFTYISDGISTLTGRPPRTREGREEFIDYQNIHPEDRERVHSSSEVMIAAGSSTQFDYRLLDAKGEPRWVHCAMNARRQADGSTLINGLLLNAEESKRLESELRAASEVAEAASHAKSRFLSNMSHEIRTPMNAVIGLAHIAMTSETNPLQAERIGKIHRAGKALLKLLNDILEYSRLDAGKLAPLIAPFDLGELKEGLQLFCLPVAETKGLRFVIDCPARTPLRWLGDATRIQQVLLNLLTNAIKFTDAGTVTLVIEASSGPAPGLRFAVRDTGIGMSAQEVQRVFEAFEQASGEIERRYGGSGLGLSISRELVQALGGTIAVESTPGEGTVFTVWLPMHAAPTLPNKPQGDLELRLTRLANHVHNHELGGARASLQALRLALIPEGRESELHRLERLLSSFDFEAAAIELVQLRMRWRGA